MALSITPESKNNLAVTNEDKSGSTVTWDEATMTWDEATGTWNAPGFPIAKESKNNLTISNENKN